MLGLNNIGLGLILYARDLATPELRGAKNAVYDLGNAVDAEAAKINAGLKMVGMGLAATVAGLASLSIINKFADAAGEFEYEMAGVGAMAGVAGDELQKLSVAVADIGLSMTKFSPKDAAMGMRTFAQAGIASNEALKALRPTLDMSVASLGQLGLEESAGLAVSGMKVFNKTAEDTTWMFDRMAKATMMSRMQFKDLPLLLGVCARGVKQIDATLEDTLLSLGMIRDVIPTTERSATALATSMEGWAKQKSYKAVKELGIVVADAGGKFRPFLDLMGDLTLKLNGMTPEARALWVQLNFGSRASAGMLILMDSLRQKAKDAGGGINGMRLAIAAMRGEMANSDGAMADFRDRMLKTWKGQKEAMGAAASGVAQVMGLPFAEVLRPFVHMIVAGLTETARLYKSLDPVFQKVLAGIVALTAFAVTITGIVVSIAAISALLATVGTTLGTVLLIVGGIVAGIGAIAVNLWVLYELFKSPIDHIKLLFVGLGELLMNWEGTMTGFTEKTAKALDGLGSPAMKDFIISTAALIYRLWKMMVGFWEWVSTTFIPLWDLFVAPFQMVWDMLAPLVDVFFELALVLFSLDGSLGKTSEGWYTFGRIVGAVVTYVVWAFIALAKVVGFITRVLLSPLIYGFKALAYTIRQVSNLFVWLKKKGIDPLWVVLAPLALLLAPILLPIAAVGAAIYAVWQYLGDGIMDVIDRIKEAWQILKTSVIAPMAKWIAAPFEAVGAEVPKWIQDFKTWAEDSGKVTKLGGAVYAEAAIAQGVSKDREGVIKEIWLMRQERALSQYGGGARLEEQEQQGVIFPTRSPSPASSTADSSNMRVIQDVLQQAANKGESGWGNEPVTWANYISLNVDGEKLQEWSDKKKKAATGKKGGVHGSEIPFFGPG